MGAPYQQFCPVAKTMELFDERWTLLVVRELVSGSEHFNDLRRGLPRISPSLLSRRLHRLVRAGIVERRVEGTTVRYVLTEAGRELEPVVNAIGTWGMRWIGELGDEDLDPKLLLWDMHRHVDADAVPPGRTVVRFEFTDVDPPDRDWWMSITRDGVDVCDDDPGYTVAVTVRASLRTLVRIWRGDTSWTAALRNRDLHATGPAELRRAVPRWFTLSDFAPIPRPTA